MCGHWDHYSRTYIYIVSGFTKYALVVQPQDISSTRRIYTSHVDSKKHPWHSSG